jgi:hypothetical protein
MKKSELIVLIKECKKEIMESKGNENLIEFEIPEWAMGALVNGDYSGLSDEDEMKLNKFTSKVVSKYGNAMFMTDDIDGKDNLGFRTYNDIDNLGSDVYVLYINPSNDNENMNENNTQIMKKSELIALIKECKKEILREEDTSTKEPKVIINIRDVAKNGYKRVYDPAIKKPIQVDSFSASAIIQVYDALTDENKVKYAKLPIARMASIAFGSTTTIKEGNRRKSRRIIKEEKIPFNIGAVLDSYLETALWSSGDDDEFSGLTIYNFDTKSKDAAKKDIIKFIADANKQFPDELETYDVQSLGHNIWLSRNGHGAGFFDDNNDGLQELARKMKEKDIYVGDDGKVYID